MKAIDLKSLRHPDGFFLNFSFDINGVGWDYDFGGLTTSGLPDIRHWDCKIWTFLDACLEAKLILAYDLDAGEISTWKGVDDHIDSRIEDWLEWFFLDGPPEQIKLVCKAATRNDIKNRAEMLESIDHI